MTAAAPTIGLWPSQRAGHDTTAREGTQHIGSIDGLRAVAVLAVITFHLNSHWLPGGFVGVDVFFVISGFVVTASLASLPAHSGLALVASFYARRMQRIVPALLVCLMVAGLAATLFIPTAWLSQTNHRTGILAFFGLSNLALASNTGDYFSPRAEFNPFTHTWSLAIEEQFYLLFPLLVGGLLATRQSARRPLALAVVGTLTAGSWLCCVVWSSTQPTQAFYLLPARYWELGVGVLLRLSQDFWAPHAQRLSARAAMAAHGLAVAGLVASLAWAQPDRFPSPWALPPVLSTALLLALLSTRHDRPAARLLGQGPMHWLGQRSYALYLWHWPVFVLMRWTCGLESTAQFVVALAATLGLAAASYRLVEQPVRLSQTLRRQQQWAVALGGLLLAATAAGATGWMFKAKPHLSLSKTADALQWFPYDEASPIEGARCMVTMRRETLAGGERTTFQPAGCSAGMARTTLFVAGDSHATAYTTLLRLHSARQGQRVVMLNMPGCPVFNLMQARSALSTDCQAFHAAVLQLIARDASSGDQLFLPSLRLQRIGDQWQSHGAGTPTLVRDTMDRSTAVADAMAALTPLAQAGIHVVLEAPKPVFAAPAFRCSDWFNQGNPACSGGLHLPQAELLAYRAAALEAMARLQSQLPHATVWDPFPLLCPASSCSAVQGDSPMFFDGDHISGRANHVLQPHFSAFIAHTP